MKLTKPSTLLALLMTMALNTQAELPESISATAETLLQNTISGLSGVAQGDLADTLKRNIKSKIINESEGFINSEINKRVNKLTPGKTAISLRNLTTKNKSIRFITIQPLTPITVDSTESTLIQASAENRTGTTGEDITINAGIAKRFLSPDKKSIYGANAFVDYQVGPGHKRASVGLELKRQNFNLNYNKYYALSDEVVVGKYKEKVIPGEEIRITGQVPYVPWSKITYNKYNWIKTNQDNIKGHRLGINVDLTKSTTLKLSKDFSGNGTSSIVLNFNLPYGPKENDKWTDFRLSEQMFANSATMSLTNIDFVNRSNRINVSKTLDGNDVEIGVFNSTTTSSVCTLKTANGVAVVDVHGSSIVGTTNSDGIVKFNNVMIPAGIVVVECHGGNYLDEATGVNKSITVQSAAVLTTADTSLNIYVTPVSDIIHKLAIEDGDMLDLEQKRSIVEQSFGLSTTLVKPDDLNLVSATSTPEGEYGLVLAAISQVSNTEQSTPEETATKMQQNIKETGALPANQITTAIRELAENPASPASANIKANLDVIKVIQGKIPEVQAFVITKIEQELTEGQTVEYFIKITTEPQDHVSLSIQATDNLTVVPEVLKLTTENWWKDNKIVVTVNEDLDAIDAVAQITHLVTSEEYAKIEVLASTIVILDNDTVNITISAPTGATSEAGATASLTMVLTSKPTADVLIPLSSSDTTEGAVSVSSITFTPTNWDIAQTITISGVDDAVQDGDISYQLVVGEVLSADLDYNKLNAADITLINTDDDSANIIITTIQATSTETGTPANLAIVLASEPTADVTIPLSTTDTTEGIVLAPSITFTPANWNVQQMIVVNGVNDAVQDGDISYKLVIGASISTDSNYNNIDNTDITLINADDDTADIALSVMTGTTSEAGTTASFTMVLTAEPTADVLIPVSSSNITEGTLSISSVIFTINDWNTPQVIVVTGVNDAVQDGDIGHEIIIGASISADSNYNNIDKTNVQVINVDDDTANFAVSAVSGSTTEAGSTASFTIALTSEPTADVLIPVSSSDTTEGTVSVSSITFTPTNWNVAQTIAITGINDEVQDGDVSYSIVLGASISLDSDYNAIDKPDLNLINQDDDTANITVSTITGGTSEAGATASFTMVLTSEPTADVLIPVSSSDTTEGTVSVANITFTPTNWNVVQTVIVTGANDEIQDSNITYNIILGASISLDLAYNAIAKPNLSLVNQDDDVANIIVSAISGATAESGTTAWITLVLTTEPIADVVISLASDNPAEGVMAQSSVTFTSSNWNTVQTVVVAGIDDMVDDGDINYKIVLDASVSTDSNYNNLAFSDIDVVNTDNDTANIIVSSISGNTAEDGTTASFTLVLASSPTANVTIPISSSDITEGTVSVSSIIFTPSNWNTVQTVIVTGVDDLDLDADINYTIVLGNPVSTDTIYAAKTISNISVININDDLQISLASLKAMIANGDDVTQVDTSAITDMSSLFELNGTFNQDISAWDVSSVSTMNRMFKGASVFNQDIGGWDVSKVTNMNQMLEATYAFNQDIGSWDVSSVTSMVNMFRSMYAFSQDISGWDTSNVTDMSSMFYSNYSFDNDISNWNVANVTWGGQDSFNTNAILKCYNTPVFTGTTRIGCYPPEIFASAISGTTSESGTTATFTVVLKSEPRADVTIPVASSDTTEGSVAISTLVFTPANWDTAQTITVTGIDDVLADGDISYNIVLGSSTTTDPDYANITKNVAVINTNYEIPETNQSLRDRVNNGEDVSGVNTSLVTDMSNLFSGKTTFNDDISGWDTSNVTLMNNMFNGATVFNKDISAWDVSKVTNMANLFNSALAFNQDIGNWNTSSVTDMSSLFAAANAFNQDISTWNTSNVTTMYFMFYNADAFNQSISSWDVSKVTTMGYMFTSADVFNGDLSGWNTSSVTKMNNVFNAAPVFNQNISNWNTSSVNDMKYMFGGATAFNQDISGWDVSNVTTMYGMFKEATNFNADISSWNTGSVTTMLAMFRDTSFNQPIGTWNLSNVTTTDQMFADNNVFNQDISGWTVGNVTRMANMFQNNHLFNQDISSWNVSNVTSM